MPNQYANPFTPKQINLVKKYIRVKVRKIRHKRGDIPDLVKAINRLTPWRKNKKSYLTVWNKIVRLRIKMGIKSIEKHRKRKKHAKRIN